MKRDKRGRVRFTYNGLRYEFNCHGCLNIYFREYVVGSEKPLFSRTIPGYRFADYKFRDKLREALDAVDSPQFTTNIFIPQSMRAVND